MCSFRQCFQHIMSLNALDPCSLSPPSNSIFGAISLTHRSCTIELKLISDDSSNNDGNSKCDNACLVLYLGNSLGKVHFLQVIFIFLRSNTMLLCLTLNAHQNDNG